ncbi:XRE family transcriptional regulator [Spongiactinospora rosea]|uniref:XRE family transcriptional regulator n=1 Tax=Spongiactinospora rosea TaxID=2248750 RepID=A0A366LKF6_9ACTN|nr:helix-turn-helix transcriptional regulator [Spongiactinospora rosea]RBQ14381.1 XRE family transcriptional regulator [Spongiactinospora rosea]
MTPARGPSVRRRRLAGELRRLRERSAWTIEETAERLGWSIAKVSRIETARTGITIPDLTRMLDLYDMPADRREALYVLARTARRRGWWDAYADSLPTDYATYIELEAETASIRAFNPIILHGLLQTEDYAREIIRSAHMGMLAPNEIDRRVDVRMTRQRLLHRQDDPLKLWVIIDEAVLAHTVGSPAIMAAQNDRLLELARLDTVTLQVLPLTKGAHPSTAGPFSILEFQERYDPQVVYVETMMSSLYIESDAEIYRYTMAFDHLSRAALDLDASTALISRIARR